MNAVSAFLIGLVFGLGLIVSGMSTPGKVLAFLDLAGAWNPSLALVMAGAVTIAAAAFRLAGKRPRTLLGQPFSVPAIGRVDRRLIAGSALFGIGWGLAGICPGPALTLLGAGRSEGALFVIAMLAGMTIFELRLRR